jgi:hypothetical protein
MAGLEHSDPPVRIECREVLERGSSDDRDPSVLAIGAFLKSVGIGSGSLTHGGNLVVWIR